MDRITFLIDEQLKREFQKLCIDCGVDMSTALKAMVRGTVDSAKVDPAYPREWFRTFREAGDKNSFPPGWFFRGSG